MIDDVGVRGVLRRSVLRSIRAYQQLTAHRPSPCRYIPSCSEYAREAVELHGSARGSALAVRRVARCHPFGGFGFDPVPPARGPSDVQQGRTQEGLVR